MSNIPYTTLYEVKKNLSLLSTTKDDSLLQDFINRSTDLITYWKERRFDVYKDTVLLDCPKRKSSNFGDVRNSFDIDALYPSPVSLTLKVEDLLEVIELVNGDEVEVTSDQYVMSPRSKFPKFSVGLKSMSGITWVPTVDGGYEEAISLTGYFGSVNVYPSCWVNTSDKVKNSGGINDAVDIIQVEDANGIADDLKSPRFQIGHMIRVTTSGESEFMLIKSIHYKEDYETYDSVTVVRGVNGTTAITHSEDSEIYVYRVPGHIEQSCIRLVMWRYRQKDTDSFERVYNLATQSVSTPSSLPADVAVILGRRGRFKI